MKVSIAELVKKMQQDKEVPTEVVQEDSSEKGQDTDLEFNFDDDEDDELNTDIPKTDEEPSAKSTTKVLETTASEIETLIDNLMEINTKQEYSRLIKLLQSAGRLADELIESQKLLD